MFEPVKELLETELGCSDVYGEIGLCDVVGRRGVYDVAVEMKTRLNFKVITQAIKRKHMSAYTYIAIPYPKRSDMYDIYSEFIEPHGIGVIYIKETLGKMEATVRYKPKFNHSYIKFRKHNSRLTDNIKEYEKDNIGGSKGGETKTSYSNMIEKVKIFLADNGWSSIDDIIENVPEVSAHYKNPKQSLTATFREKWNSHWIVRDRDNDRKCFIFSLK